jgi:hypothetical protein
MLWPIYPRGKSPQYPLDRSLDGPQNRSGCGGKQEKSHNCPCRESNSGHPASTYRLSSCDIGCSPYRKKFKQKLCILTKSLFYIMYELVAGFVDWKSSLWASCKVGEFTWQILVLAPSTKCFPNASSAFEDEETVSLFIYLFVCCIRWFN